MPCGVWARTVHLRLTVSEIYFPKCPHQKQIFLAQLPTSPPDFLNSVSNRQNETNHHAFPSALTSPNPRPYIYSSPSLTPKRTFSLSNSVRTHSLRLTLSLDSLRSNTTLGGKSLSLSSFLALENRSAFRLCS